MKKILLLLAVILLTSCSKEELTTKQTFKYWRISYTLQMQYIRTDTTTKEIYEAHTPETIYLENGYNREYVKTNQ